MEGGICVCIWDDKRSVFPLVSDAQNTKYEENDRPDAENARYKGVKLRPLEDITYKGVVPLGAWGGIHGCRRYLLSSVI